MKITVERFYADKDTTLSVVYVDGQSKCFGLEDEGREVKVAGETRIPAGKYHVGVRQEGSMTQRYFERYSWFRGMLWVQDVPDFEYVYIHIGNDDDDTAGCLLVGSGATLPQATIANSSVAFKELYEVVIDSAQNGELEIEFLQVGATPEKTSKRLLSRLVKKFTDLCFRCKSIWSSIFSVR